MQLVQFQADASVVSTQNARTGTTTVRLQTAKEFKTAKGLKGQEGRKAYNEYLREHGKANTAGLAAALTSGELLVKGVRDSKNSMAVSFVKASSIKDPAPVKAAVPTKEEALAVLGLTQEQLELLASVGK